MQNDMENEVLAAMIANRIKTHDKRASFEKKIGRPIADVDDLCEAIMEIIQTKDKPFNYLADILPSKDMPLEERRILAVTSKGGMRIVKITSPAHFVESMGVGETLTQYALHQAISSFKNKEESVDICVF